jgi:phosphoglycolate phosphatase
MEKKMIKMVAFDFDGTISDTIPMCIEVFKKAMLPYTGYELTKSEIIQTFGLNEIGMVKTLVKDNWRLALRDFYFYYEKMHDSCRTPFPQICDLIEYLKERNILVSLITGKGQKSCDISLKKLELEHCFCDVMVGLETRNNKAELISKLLEKYDIKKDEFYYVGDAVSDITACREVGVTCLSAAWSESVELEQLKDTNPYFVFDNISSLKKFFESNYD